MADLTKEEIEERLKAALWFAVGRVVDEQTARLNRNATPQFIGALMAMVWAQLETMAVDLESFSRHAQRDVVTSEDVLLVARRNDDLHKLLDDYLKDMRAAKEKEREKGKGRADR